MPRKVSPSSSPIFKSSDEEEGDSNSGESSQDEGDEGEDFISSDENEGEEYSSESEIITPKGKKIVSSSESEIITPKGKKIVSSSESEIITPKSKSKTSKSKKIVSSPESEIKTPKSKTPKNDLIKKDSNERDVIFQSRKLITDIIAKTYIEGEQDDQLHLATGEAAINLGRQINNKFWFGLTYDTKMEDLISKYIEEAPELEAFIIDNDLNPIKSKPPSTSTKLVEKEISRSEIIKNNQEVAEENIKEALHNATQEEQEGNKL